MKKIKIYTTILSLLFLIAACSEDFLDEKPLGIETIDSYYTNEANAIKAVNSVYSYLKHVGNRMAFGDILSDDAWKGGGGVSDVQSWYELLTFNIDPTNGAINDFWSENYQAIAAANVAIQKIPDIDMDAGLRDRLVGEARFMRAYYYFELVRLFGSIPLVTEPLGVNDLNIERTPIDQVWAFIETEFEACSQILPESYPPSDHGRATSYAAMGLLARVHLFQGEFGPVETYAKAIMDASALHSMNPSFNDNFRIDNYDNNPEFVFEAKSYYIDGYSSVTTASLLAAWTGIRYTDFGWGFDNPTLDLYNAYEEGDPRRDWTIAADGYVYEGEDTLVINGGGKPAYSIDGFASIKWYELKSQRQQTDDLDHTMQKSFPILRMADVILMYAEACNENGEPGLALDALNSVRERARNSVSPASAVPADLSITDQELLRQAIWNERRLELAFEWHRYYDLLRTNQAGKVLRAFGEAYDTPKGQAFDDTKHYLFPIPQAEITRTGGVITQNPNY